MTANKYQARDPRPRLAAAPTRHSPESPLRTLPTRAAPCRPQVKPIPEDHAEDDGLISADEFAALPTRLVALEQSGACARAFWGPLRPFEMALRDGAGRELFRVHRELRFPPLLFCGCFPCCGCFVAPQHAEARAGTSRPTPSQRPRLLTAVRRRRCWRRTGLRSAA